jgi:hypothetical protein
MRKTIIALLALAAIGLVQPPEVFARAAIAAVIPA